MVIDLKNFAKQKDFFWFIRFIADLLKIFGRVAGMFKPKQYTPVNLTLVPQNHLSRNLVTYYGNQLFFNPKMRFIYTPTSMYAYDIEWGGVIDFPEMLKKHLRNIMVGNGGVVDDKFFTFMEKYVFWRSSIIYPWYIRPYLKRYLKEVIVGPSGKVDESPLLASFQRMKILETFTRVSPKQ